MTRSSERIPTIRFSRPVEFASRFVRGLDAPPVPLGPQAQSSKSEHRCNHRSESHNKPRVSLFEQLKDDRVGHNNRAAQISRSLERFPSIHSQASHRRIVRDRKENGDDDRRRRTQIVSESKCIVSNWNRACFGRWIYKIRPHSSREMDLQTKSDMNQRE